MQIQYPIIFIPNELTKKPILKFQILIKSQISNLSNTHSNLISNLLVNQQISKVTTKVNILFAQQVITKLILIKYWNNKINDNTLLHNKINIKNFMIKIPLNESMFPKLQTQSIPQTISNTNQTKHI